MILQALLLSSLALHSLSASDNIDFSVTELFDGSGEGSGEDVAIGSINDIPDAEISEGSGEDLVSGDDGESWNNAETDMGWEEGKNEERRRVKRQATEQQQPTEAQAPQEFAQRGRGRDSHDSDDSREGRHRPDRPSCRTVRCTAGTECIIENGRPTCRPTRPQPARSCRDVNCPRDTRCRMERDPRCRDRFCNEQPVCVRESRPSCQNVQCPAGLRCRIVEDQNCRGRDCREVVTCVPGGGNPCDSVRCPFGTICQWNGRQPTCAPIVIDQCLNARCQSGFQCRTVDGQARCFPVTSPSCRQNEVWAQCASPCEPSCGNASPLICPLRCDPPRCQCAPGFWRHRSGSCVQQNQCFF